MTIWHIHHNIKKGRVVLEQFTVEFYEKDNGERPAEEFMRSLDKKMSARLYAIIEVLEEKGNLLREPYSKYLEDGIFEIRGKVGSDISRVLYFFYYEGKIILTNGFIKKTQKTPRSQIETAKKYRADYIKRKDDSYEEV